jgi:cephalosporin-C deacetylase
MPMFDLPLEELRSYRPSPDEPPDLDDFWRATLEEARRSAADPQLVRVDAGLELVTVDDVTYSGFAGDRVRAWLVRPKGAIGPLPVLVQYVGYGSGRGLPHEHLTWAAAGYAHLVVDSRGQGGGWGSGGSTPDPHGAGPATPGFLTRGILDPDQHYYRRLITDAVRAVDAVGAVPGLDEAKVAVSGTSQGGGLALAVAGLASGVAAVVADVPFLCHFRRAVEVTDLPPYVEITRYLSVNRDHEEAAFRTLSYLDAAHLAARATAPALFSVGLMDRTCPPSTVYAAYNRYGELGGRQADLAREIDVYPFNDHEGGEAYRFPRQLRWLRTHLR